MFLALAAMAWAWYHTRASEGLDFYQFRAGGRLARQESIQNLYSPLTRVHAHDELMRGEALISEKLQRAASARAELELFSTPFLYATFGVFHHSYDDDLRAYRILSLIAFVAGVLLLARAARMRWVHALLLLAFLLLLFQPLKSELRVVNVNSLQLCAVGGAAYLLGGTARWKWLAGAALLGVVSAFKPNIAVVVPLLLAYRLIARDRLRFAYELAGAAAGGAFALLVGAMWFRSFGAWLQWFDAAKALASTPLPLESGNVAMFARHSLVAAVALFVVILAAFFFGRRDEESITIIGAGLLVYLLAASLVWLHYLVLALPLAIALLADGSNVRRAIGALALTLIGADIWTTLLTVETPKGEALVLWSGLALLLIAALWRFGTRDRLSGVT
ncbi:MAG TPA: hypothetical protein VF111_11300 [Thermoanaerobaculia bacterium]